MRVEDYYHNIFVPANGAVSAMRQCGIPIDRERLRDTRAAWLKRLAAYEAYVEGEAEAMGLSLKYSKSHQLSPKAMKDLMYSPQGLNLEPIVFTPKTGQPSTSKEAIMPYASLANPEPDDSKVLYAHLKIRSIAKGLATHIDRYEEALGADSCLHPQFNWGKVVTPRISAENPPVHQIPTKSDKEVATGIKRCIVPRINPAGGREWNPKKHGSCWEWDIAGAEMAVRGAMLTYLFCRRSPRTLWEYVRAGKDIHSRTADLLYNKPSGTYGKGDWEREVVAKIANFALLYGGSWFTLQNTLWVRGRIWWPEQKARKKHALYFEGHPELAELYEWDKIMYGKNGYCEDGYGRRRAVPIPRGARFQGSKNGRALWYTDDTTAWRELDSAFHIMANSPTQGMSATDNLWMIALCFHGERNVELRVVPMWENQGGVLFPEAKPWQLHEGPGPGGKPFLSWHMNTVHDSGWGDCAPGYLEPTMKLINRRCTALPFDWRLKADVPYRIDFKCGPDMGSLRPYNDVAKEFGLEPMPER